MAADPTKRTYHVLGVPLRAGSLYPGSENDALAYREAGLIGRLQAAGCRVQDDGDVTIPSYLPHHQVPPVRNWPAPRIAWDCVSAAVAPLLAEPGHVPLLIGCDCSVVVGTTQAVQRAAPGGVHLIYVDGDLDAAAPDPSRCQSAAALALWLVTHGAPFRAGPPLTPSQVTVVGWSKATPYEVARVGHGSLPLSEVRRLGPAEAARQALQTVPASASIVLHFDIDVLREQDLPAAYFPHAGGLTLGEAADLLGVLLADPRIRVIEVTEYAALRDLDRHGAGILVRLVAGALALR